MNQKEIEEFKSMFTRMAMKGSRIRSSRFRVDGKLVGVGFKPFWTNVYDTKIEKLELNVLDKKGKIMPFNILHVVGYEVIGEGGREGNGEGEMTLDIRIFSPAKGREEPYDKIRIEFVSDK